VVDAEEEKKADVGISVEDGLMVAAVADDCDGDVFTDLLLLW